MKDGRIAFDAPADEAITADRLRSLFEAPVTVHRIDGRPFVLHHA